MKCLHCENQAVGCQKIMKSLMYSKNNYSFNLYYCKTHLKKQLNIFDIEIGEFDNE